MANPKTRSKSAPATSGGTTRKRGAPENLRRGNQHRKVAAKNRGRKASRIALLELEELPLEMRNLRLVREDISRKAKLQVLFDDSPLPPGFQKIRYYGWMSSNSKVSLDEVKWLVWLFLGWTCWLATAAGHEASFRKRGPPGGTQRAFATRSPGLL